MIATRAPNPHPRVSTAGAWLGFGVAAWAALTVAWHVLCLAAVSVAPAVLDRAAARVEEQAAGADVAAQFGKLTDLAFEGLRIFASYSRIADGGAAVLGFALFAAGFALVRGSETGRRAARFLLALKAAHTLASAAWLVALFGTTLSAWSGRFAAAIEDVARSDPRAASSAVARVSESMQSLPIAAVVVAAGSAAVTAALFRAAGRPSARGWCAARSGSAVASSAPPR